ncbi:MAG: hypothetical protein J0L93_02775 [Deltaproteobacteria bacterium]|nr:hypothetical protein [Deltaproteobacteria bacterium]
MRSLKVRADRGFGVLEVLIILTLPIMIIGIRILAKFSEKQSRELMEGRDDEKEK